MYIPKGKDDNMRKLLLVFLFLSGIMTVSADDFNYLTFARNDGTMKSISIDNLKLSFAGGNVVAATGDETLTMPLSDLAKMFFAAVAQSRASTSTRATTCKSAVDISLVRADVWMHVSAHARRLTATLPTPYLCKAIMPLLPTRAETCSLQLRCQRHPTAE